MESTSKVASISVTQGVCLKQNLQNSRIDRINQNLSESGFRGLVDLQDFLVHLFMPLIFDTVSIEGTESEQKRLPKICPTMLIDKNGSCKIQQ